MKGIICSNAGLRRTHEGIERRQFDGAAAGLAGGGGVSPSALVFLAADRAVRALRGLRAAQTLRPSGFRHGPRQSRRPEPEISPELSEVPKGISRSRTTWSWSWKAKTSRKTASSSSASPPKCRRKPICFRTFFIAGRLTMMGSKALLFAPEADLVKTEDDAARGAAVHPPVHADDESRFLFRSDQHGVPHRAARNQRGDRIADPVAARVDAHRAAGRRGRCSGPACRRRPTSAPCSAAAKARCCSNYITFADGKIFLLTTHAPIAGRHARPDWPASRRQADAGRFERPGD